MAKYDALRDRLAVAGSTVTLSFDDIAELVGGLPDSAYRYAVWWSNDSNGHVQAAAWLSAGCRVEAVDLQARRVTFARNAPSG